MNAGLWEAVTAALSDAETGQESAPLETAYEILDLQHQLSTALGESDSSTEALRASNEELQSVNEELRSTTEELETSKEELQSVNEELTTVNYDLKLHLETSAKAHDDLSNFLAASDIATVFVDRGLRVHASRLSRGDFGGGGGDGFHSTAATPLNDDVLRS